MNFSKFLEHFFVEHLQTAASEAVTENSLGNTVRGERFSARDQKLHLISIFATCLTELKFSARAENLHIINPLNV